LAGSRSLRQIGLRSSAGLRFETPEKEHAQWATRSVGPPEGFVLAGASRWDAQ
jgi:hypothetical protein